jgi:hypothetical protein
VVFKLQEEQVVPAVVPAWNHVQDTILAACTRQEDHAAAAAAALVVAVCIRFSHCLLLSICPTEMDLA